MLGYNDIVNGFGIKHGDRIWLSSELIQFAIKLKAEGKRFDGHALIEAFQNAVGQNGTLLIPTFSFEFSNHGYYDIKKTKGTTGALGNLALTMDGFQRTQHPMHSFAVWGKDSEMLAGMENRHSFGLDSPFGYCLGRRVKQVILGTDYVHAMTFIHYAEAVCNVPYRIAKSFTGTYVDAQGRAQTRTYDYAARRLELDPEERFNRIGAILEDQGVSKKVMIEGIASYQIDLADSFLVICEDILRNKCENIYDFSIERGRVFGEG